MENIVQDSTGLIWLGQWLEGGWSDVFIEDPILAYDGFNFFAPPIPDSLHERGNIRLLETVSKG